MRKIISRQERKRIRRRNQFIVGFILVFLMVTSTLGFAFQGSGKNPTQSNSNQNTVNYNGFTFENINGFWVLGNFVFRNLPDDVPEVGQELKNLESYRGKVLYLNSESIGAESEVIVNLGQIASKIETVNKEQVGGCEDNFIIIEKNIQEEIIQDGNCVFIHGDVENLIKLTDQFLFKIMGIK